MSRFVVAEEGHIANVLAPVNIAGGKTSQVWSMSGWAHASILISLGVTGAASTVTVLACDDFVPTTTQAIPFAVYKAETAGGDVTGPRTSITSAGFATSTNDGIFYAIEVDAHDLPTGYPNLRVALSDPGAATYGAIQVVLSGGRYAGPSSPTVLS